MAGAHKVWPSDSFGCRVLKNKIVFVDRAIMFDDENEDNFLDGYKSANQKEQYSSETRTALCNTSISL